MSGVEKEKLFIRPVHIDDTPALYRICLLTADAGQSAEALHHFPELLGLHYIDPYVKLSPAFGFVLVSGTAEGNEEVLGYLLATPDTRAHEAIAEEQCYPPLRLKYPNNPYPPESTARDQGVINRVHKPLIRPQGLVDITLAHIHINILPQAQRQGWGVKLIDYAVEHLKEQGQSGLFLGIDSRNHNARAFYLKVGFKLFPFPDKEYFYLDFDDWKGPKRTS
ncbi:acyl-CoA N-acyltransferase [Ceratobasidium sp. AG-I]|nr:acyl-CoA N-acyltransferase [Ceratobasidium sp. AG-I]